MNKIAYFFERNRRAKHLKFLQANINDGMALDDIVDVFEKMCQMPAAGSMYLFETGRFGACVGNPMFWFSLTRQYPGRDDEYEQLHVNIMYEPTDENAVFSKSVWDIDLEQNFFDYIRSSSAYLWAREHHICKIDIYMDET